MDSFKNFMESAGAFLNTAFTGFDNQWFGTGHSLDLPTPTLDIPTRTVQSRIKQIFYTNNPICITLEDGTLWKMHKEQWDFLKKHGKEPHEGSIAQLDMFLDGTIKSVSIL